MIKKTQKPLIVFVCVSVLLVGLYLYTQNQKDEFAINLCNEAIGRNYTKETSSYINETHAECLLLNGKTYTIERFLINGEVWFRHA